MGELEHYPNNVSDHLIGITRVFLLPVAKNSRGGGVHKR
jgi:hypothetical protein